MEISTGVTLCLSRVSFIQQFGAKSESKGEKLKLKTKKAFRKRKKKKRRKKKKKRAASDRKGVRRAPRATHNCRRKGKRLSGDDLGNDAGRSDRRTGVVFGLRVKRDER